MALIAVPVLAKPGRYHVELLDEAGRTLDRSPVVIRSARFRRQNIVLSRKTASLAPSPGEMETMREFRNTVSDTRHWDEPFMKPVPGCMTSPFGVLRLHNGKLTGGYHGGVDQRGAEGTPIRAIASGEVKVAEMFNIHGGTVGLDHGHGVSSAYLHMSGFDVQEGASVKKGDVIGYVGTTGRSTAPHLHWSLFVSGHSVNPLQWVDIPPCAAAKPKPKAKKRSP
jgi:murein DD-endopeptidase MepM/ murein hydrolase activator NlpD